MTTHGSISTGMTHYQAPGQYEFRGVVYFEGFADVHKLLEYNEYRKDDIMLATYPKSGTHWMQELMFAINQDGDTKRVGDNDISERFPWLEATCAVQGHRLASEVIPQMKSPRLIKTHMQRYFFDNAFRKNVKFVVLNRNPRDVLVSYFHFFRHIPRFQFDGDFNDFFQLFMNKKLVHGDWFDWVLGWWQERDNPNVLFVTYEAMKQDIVKETRRVANFMGKEFNDEVIQKMVDSCSFDKLKGKRMKDVETEKEGSGCYRKGEIGDWTNYFTQEQVTYFDALYKSKMDDIDLGFE